MSHTNFHVVEAANNVECGQKLGLLFGMHLRGYVGDARRGAYWKDHRHEAQDLLDITRRYFPAYIQELTAYADAARLPLLDLWTYSIEDQLGDEDEDEHCTTLVTNSGRLLSHNEDWDEDTAEDICILRKTVGGRTTLEFYYYGCPLGGTALSINSRGYIQAINSLDHDDWQVGVPKHVIARALADVQDLDKELPGLLAIPRSSGFAHHILSPDGRLTSIECSAKRQAVYHPKLPFSHTNHYLHPDLAGGGNAAGSRSSRARLAASRAGAREAMSRQEVDQLMSDGGGKGSSTLCNQNTIARAIVELSERVVRIWLRRESRKGWLEYPIDFLTSAPVG